LKTGSWEINSQRIRRLKSGSRETASEKAASDETARGTAASDWRYLRRAPGLEHLSWRPKQRSRCSVVHKPDLKEPGFHEPWFE
jgi:hypothetical protein